MKISREYNYRYAKEILSAIAPIEVAEILATLNNPLNVLNLAVAATDNQRALSAQIKQWFVARNWLEELPSLAAIGMKYDLGKNLVRMEIEFGHERLVFPDFFEFLADHAKEHIPAGILIVTDDPKKFGHTWHCSLSSTKRKIESIKQNLTVPLWVIGVNP